MTGVRNARCGSGMHELETAIARRAINAEIPYIKVLVAAGRTSETLMAKTTFMVIEHFKGGDAAPVYRRFRERGRLAPEGLNYVGSWVDTTLERCYQVMEAEDPALLQQWIANWSDIVDFEVHPVISSADALERIAPRL
jgi:hypothetical protein